jgi:hypothetical protein
LDTALNNMEDKASPLALHLASERKRLFAHLGRIVSEVTTAWCVTTVPVQAN